MLGIPPADAANVPTGKVIYEKNCQVCHGAKGKGDGYRAVNPPPADLTARSIQRKGNVELAQTIAHGYPNTAMGRWEVELSEGDIQHLVDDLRTLAQ